MTMDNLPWMIWILTNLVTVVLGGIVITGGWNCF